MEWINGQISRSSTFDPNVTLYRANDEVYDEIIIKDGKYYVIRRCGIDNYNLNATYTDFVTDGKIIVYPLDKSLYTEEELDVAPIKTYSENTSVVINGGLYDKTILQSEVQKKVKEYSDTYIGNNLNIDTEYIDPARPSCVYKIKNMLPHELIEGDRFENDRKSPGVLTIDTKDCECQQIIQDNNGNVIYPSIDRPAHINSLSEKNGDSYELNAGYIEQSDLLWEIKGYCTGSSMLNDLLQLQYFDKYYITDNEFARHTAVKPSSFSILYASTYVYAVEDLEISATAYRTAEIYINNIKIPNSNTYGTSPIIINLSKGLNFIEVIGHYTDALTTPFGFDVELSKQNNVFMLGTNVGSCMNTIMYQKTINIPSTLIGGYYFGIGDRIKQNDENKYIIEKNIKQYTLTADNTISFIQSNGNYNLFSTESFNSREDDALCSVMSSHFYPCSYKQILTVNNGCAIAYHKGSIYFTLPATKYFDINFVLTDLLSKNIEFYYASAESEEIVIYSISSLYEFINQYKSNYANILINGNIQLANISLDTCFTCAISKSSIPVKPTKQYILKRPQSGDLCVIQYHNIDNKIIGYSENLATDATEYTITIPDNCYYINILDGVNPESHAYSLIEVDTYNRSNTSISTINITQNGSTNVITLPHELNPGDELSYDIDYDEWTYYPLSTDEDFIVYDNFDKIPVSASISCQDDIWLYATVSCIDVRILGIPKNLADEYDPYTGNNGYGYVEWDEIPGAYEYLIYVNNALVASVLNKDQSRPRYDFTSEQFGSIRISSYNDLFTGDLSNSIFIQSVPNTPILKSVDSVYENSRYYVTVQFNANSVIANTYDVYYSLDGSNDIQVSMDRDGVYGELKEFTFQTPSISNNFIVKLTATDNTGVNDYSDNVTLLTNKGFDVWTYKKVNKNVLVSWIDDFQDEAGYSIKYKIADGAWETLITDGKSGAGSRLLEYIQLEEDQEMKVCLAVIRNGYVNIYTKPITVSKALDLTLIPPKEFTGTKTVDGDIQFTWKDDYKVDAAFELYYQYSDGTSETIIIPKESAVQGQYVYVYNAQIYGFITAKVKMTWELGESDYTDNIIVYNIPTVTEAPTFTTKIRENSSLHIKWETYEYVDHYELYFTVDGVQTIVNLIDSEYKWEIPMDKTVMNLSIKVKAVFIDSSTTNISKSLTYSICNGEYPIKSMVYTHINDNKNVYTTIMSRGLIEPFYMYTYSFNSYASYYKLLEKTYSSYLFTDYLLYDNYWGHNVGQTYPEWTTIKGSFDTLYKLCTTTYQKILDELQLHTMIYHVGTVEYPLNTVITKLIIACFGDSITAGHPNYWEQQPPFAK